MMWENNNSPGTVWGSWASAMAQDMRLDKPTNLQHAQKGSTVNVWSNDHLDLRPPGVRDQIANPSYFGQVEYRSSVFDNNRQFNAAPVVNWDKTNEIFTHPAMQRRGQLLWDICNDKQDVCPIFWQYGRWQNGYTGFTAFRHLKPATTMNKVE